jgi:hypothetical protein
LAYAALRIRQLIDDVSEQDRFDELRGCECQIGKREGPSQGGFRAEQPEDACVKTQELHDAGTIRARLQLRRVFTVAK